MLIRYVFTCKHSQYRHHVGDTETLKEIVEGLTGDPDEAVRIATIAGQMRIGDGFTSPGMMLTCEEDK